MPHLRPRRLVALGVAVALLPLAPLLATSTPAAAADTRDRMAGPRTVLTGTDLDRPSLVPRVDRAGADPSARASLRTASFVVTYTGFTPQQQAAFQQAVDTWASLIVTSQPIRIDARLERLGPGILGSAGPTVLIENNSSAGGRSPATFYPVALLNAIEGRDNAPGEADISAAFTSDSGTFYFGTDGNAPAWTYDFTTVVLHEIGHGLGFIGNIEAYTRGGALVGGWDVGSPAAERRPFVFDRKTQRLAPGGQQSLFSLGQDTPALGQAVTTGRSGWSGRQATTANGGVSPELFTPEEFSLGTSYSHLDETLFRSGTPNSLMTPFINEREVIRDPGEIVLGTLRDMGWRTLAAGTLRISGPFVSAARSTVTLTGRAQPGQAVQIFFRKRGTTAYIARRNLVAGTDGAFRTTYLANDDYRYFARVAGRDSTMELTQTRPVVEGAAIRFPRRGSTFTITGRANPGSFVDVSFRRASDPPGSYPTVRRVRTGSSGVWTKPVVMTTDYRFFARGENGQKSIGTVLLDMQ